MPVEFCKPAHSAALPMVKTNEPERVVTPVVAAPVVFVPAAAVVLLIMAVVAIIAVGVAPPPPAAVVVVASSAAEPTTHSVSNNWRIAILRAGVSHMRNTCVPAKTAAVPPHITMHAPKLHNYTTPV